MERHNIESQAQGDPSSMFRRIITEYLAHQNVRLVCSELDHHDLEWPSRPVIRELIEEVWLRPLAEHWAFAEARVDRSASRPPQLPPFDWDASTFSESRHA